ncbi:uncharacterized protein VTP21DRAFT_9153 [Calcarisporiella thermophila]|uniref:uncharacterized protein n=1 Tax=Calcarisporiella thermophila TaxID=911321 RepID=UPI0037427603
MDDPMEISADENAQMAIVAKQGQSADEEPPSVLDNERFAKKNMPDLGIEVEDFQVYHWEIKDWKSLDKRITGPNFEVGGWKWRILLFPGGNNIPDQISCYLDFADAQTAPAGWHVCGQFALAISNPHKPNIYVFHHAHHRFTAEEADWGFTRFVDFKRAFEGQELPRSLIEDGETRISAYVRVLKDKTGVLWHNFINYDSKKETGYVGMTNQGATCYMNSMLQSLYCTNYFRKAVYQIPTENDEPAKSMALALQRVFYNLQFTDQAVGTNELTKSFGWDSLDAFMQHDVQEFNRVLQDHLEAKMKNTPADGAIDRLFVGKTKSYIKCINVDYESSRIENYYDIQLNVKGCKTLRDSFKEYIMEETLEGDNKYMAEGFGLQDAKKGVKFLSFPPVLHLQLKRYEYDMMRDTMVKINDRHEFPFEIDLEEFLAPEADRTKPHKYRLHGVLVHSGDLHGGHYFALLKPEKEGKWLKFDDDRVVPVTDKEVLEDNYGGESLNGYLRTGLRTLKRFTNAYMLVYIRESEMDWILSPVRDEDIPVHLQTRIEKEKLALETRRREREEMHLYLTARIISDQTMQRHQGFDLANFEDKTFPLSETTDLRVLKTETYPAFKQRVAAEFGLPVERFRLWVMVNRQNKTIRPDTPIPENDPNLTMETVRDKMASRTSDLKLYLESADRPLSEKMVFPPEGSNYILIFIKHFNLETQTIEGLGHMYVLKNSKVGEIVPQLNERAGLPPQTQLKLFEEIKPSMIEAMNPRASFSSSEIQDGDILCVQRDVSHQEATELEKNNRFSSAKKFYDHLANRVLVQFKPKVARFPTTQQQQSLPEFELMLSHRMHYDLVAQKVAERLSVLDPMKLRFTNASPPLNLPRNMVRRTQNTNLVEMLGPAFGAKNNVLYYEVLEISILELESKRMVSVVWTGKNLKEETTVDVVVEKAGIIADLVREVKTKLNSEELTSMAEVRVVHVEKCRVRRVFSPLDPIADIPDNALIYVEEILPEELEAMQDDNYRLIEVVHFNKDPQHLHGLPFQFLLRAGEPISETKCRLQARLGMGDKEFAKVQIAVLKQDAPADYIEEEEEEKEEGAAAADKGKSAKVLVDIGNWNADILGLDYPGRAKPRNGGMERAIFIKG